MTIEELIARLEAATGPCRELDVAISVAVGRDDETTLLRYTNGTEKRVPTSRNCWGGQVDSPRYTASIDAALTLVPEGFCWEVRKGYVPEATVWQIGCEYDEGSGRTLPHAQAPTPAIALCIAALRARP